MTNEDPVMDVRLYENLLRILKSIGSCMVTRGLCPNGCILMELINTAVIDHA